MTDTIQRPRPLSPHLQVYRWPMTMAMSIAHRVTGVALYVGMLLLVWLVLAAASGQHAYDVWTMVAGSIIGKLVLIGFTWALFHHMLGGIRHFIWDMGAGLDAPARDTIAWATLVGSIALTIIIWAIAWALR